jgi:hypothetical protein
MYRRVLRRNRHSSCPSYSDPSAVQADASDSKLPSRARTCLKTPCLYPSRAQLPCAVCLPTSAPRRSNSPTSTVATGDGPRHRGDHAAARPQELAADQAVRTLTSSTSRTARTRPSAHGVNTCNVSLPVDVTCPVTCVLLFTLRRQPLDSERTKYGPPPATGRVNHAHLRRDANSLRSPDWRDLQHRLLGMWHSAGQRFADCPRHLLRRSRRLGA